MSYICAATLKLKLPHLLHMCGNAAGQLMTGERWLRATKDSEYRGFPFGLNYGLVRNNATAISYKGTIQAVRKTTRPVSTPGGSTQTQTMQTLRCVLRKDTARHREGQTRTRLLKTRKSDFPKASRLWITCRHNRLWCRYSGLGRSYKRLGPKCICLERRYKRLGVQ